MNPCVRPKQKKNKRLFPASDRPYSEAPTLIFFFSFWEKKVNKLKFAVYKRKRREDEKIKLQHFKQL